MTMAHGEPLFAPSKGSSGSPIPLRLDYDNLLCCRFTYTDLDIINDGDVSTSDRGSNGKFLGCESITFANFIEKDVHRPNIHPAQHTITTLGVEIR